MAGCVLGGCLASFKQTLQLSTIEGPALLHPAHCLRECRHARLPAEQRPLPRAWTPRNRPWQGWCPPKLANSRPGALSTA